MTEIPQFSLNNGNKMPSVGLGCWMGAPGGGQRVYDMCSNAFKAGYRHLDTAAGYANEEQVGKAIRDSGIPRSEFFVTTKLRGDHNVKESFEESLQRLDVDYIDLYLVHWPQVFKDGKILSPEEEPTIVQTWKEMEGLLETGRVKNIGVSNFSIKTLEILLPHCSVVPATNQVELHPCYPQNDLKEYCESKGILLTAYSPLGRSTFFFEDPTIQKLAEKNSCMTAQIVLSWAVQRGTIIVPKSEDPGRMLANITLVKLSEEDFTTVNTLHKSPGLHKSLLAFDDKKDGTVFGWTYEQLGWNIRVGGEVVEA
ncbi:Aldo-keto reductase [Mycena indigotica]|uniref:Aldo-keto reductase n=1 Tax=Mycena indigotica TaxID=2126181 RepID=A0A8H6TD32_9AGAR|nr:Aldo-keto reductase [Mycena indigotica]KAF7315216.1 Aldo-keto reductase [Mycena indigotica]